MEKLYVFRDRLDAGRRLGEWLREHGVKADVVYGVPAGGVPVAYMVSMVLGLKLDVLICRKILIPWDREAGFGAVAPDGSYFVDEAFAEYLGLTREAIEEAIKEQLIEVKRRLMRYRCGEPYTGLRGLSVIVVDDGIAAGYTMSAAVSFLLKQGVKHVVVAVPTCHAESIKRIARKNVDIYCFNPRSQPIYAVADAYREWRDLDDEEVLEYLRKAREKNMLYYKGNCL